MFWRKACKPSPKIGKKQSETVANVIVIKSDTDKRDFLPNIKMNVRIIPPHADLELVKTIDKTVIIIRKDIRYFLKNVFALLIK
tara:strand:+ start:284 stop:535 length:252 start_codon:yes stop_codon:yes gene_type:complete